MKKYGVIIDMTNNFLAFWPGHYIHIRAISPTILSSPSSLTEIVVVGMNEFMTS